MKRKIAILLVVAMGISIISGCGKKSDTKDDKKEETTTATETKEEETEDIDVRKAPKVTILGEDYMFPMTYKEFAAKGWKPLDEEELSVDIPYQWKDYCVNGDKIIKFYCVNLTGEPTTLENCYVTGFILEDEPVSYSQLVKYRQNILPGDVKIADTVSWGESVYSSAYDVLGPDYYVSLLVHSVYDLEYDLEVGDPEQQRLYYTIKHDGCKLAGLLSLEFFGEGNTLNRLQMDTPYPEQ